MPAATLSRKNRHSRSIRSRYAKRSAEIICIGEWSCPALRCNSIIRVSVTTLP